MIMGTVPKCTKKHLAAFYAGWFGVEKVSQIPDHKNPDTYLTPLKTLLKVVAEVEESHELLLSNPLKLGADSRHESDLGMADTSASSIAPPEPMESSPKDGPWSDVMEVDPLMEKHGWNDMETMQYAKKLMVKFGHTEEKFEDYLKFLRLGVMPEGDLLGLFRILYHTPLANTLKNKADHCGVPFLGAYSKVEEKLGYPITTGSSSSEVMQAVQKVLTDGF
jgi:hypothetical protein